MTKDTRKPPSRIKYEQSHPTVSCRISKEVYDRLQEVKENEGKSFAGILKVGLGILELKVKKDEQAYSRGYRDGYHQAEFKFKITYACNICGGPIVVNTRDEKETIKRYMEDQGWGHRGCHEKE